jgi:hypothetical protein
MGKIKSNFITIVKQNTILTIATIAKVATKMAIVKIRLKTQHRSWLNKDLNLKFNDNKRLILRAS